MYEYTYPPTGESLIPNPTYHMPTNLLTKDALNVAVSCFANYETPTNPKTINLLTWLRSTKHRQRVESLRLVLDKAERDSLKANLPAITPSGVFDYRQESSLVVGSHTRLVQFDIDLQDNELIRNYNDLKKQIARLPFVAYCALSASGLGYWGLVPIAYPERHGQHFDALKRVFGIYRINIDSKPRNVASLRGYSFDDNPYLPDQVQLFELYDEPPKLKPKPFSYTPNADNDRNRVELCVTEIVRRSLYLGSSYGSWFAIGCSLANTFGESGRDYFIAVSQKYPRMHKINPDKQYDRCLKAASKATLGTFFHECKQAGVDWKDLLPTQPHRTCTDRPNQLVPLPLNTKPFTPLVPAWIDYFPTPGCWDTATQLALSRQCFIPLID